MFKVIVVNCKYFLVVLVYRERKLSGLECLMNIRCYNALCFSDSSSQYKLPSSHIRAMLFCMSPQFTKFTCIQGGSIKTVHLEIPYFSASPVTIKRFLVSEW